MNLNIDQYKRSYKLIKRIITKDDKLKVFQNDEAMSDQPSFYDILNVEPTATAEEIKRSYQQLALKHHPDKRTEEIEEDSNLFIAIDEAWKVLRDPKLRRIYDFEQRQAAYNDKPIVHETLTKEDFDYDSESELYYHNCRCGGVYVLPDEETEKVDGQPSESCYENEESIYIACDECSLVIEFVKSKR